MGPPAEQRASPVNDFPAMVGWRSDTGAVRRPRVCYAEGMQTLRILTVVSLFLACTPKEAETGGDETSSGALTDGPGVSSATGTETDPTTTTTTTTASMGTTVSTSEGSTSGDVSTTVQTASSGAEGTPGTSDPITTTTGDTEGGSLAEACAALCMHLDQCKPGVVGPVDQCIAGCDVETGTPSCIAAIADQWACVAGLSCEEALKFIEASPESCLAEVGATDQACMDEGCSGEVGGGGTTCEFQQQCMGPKQTITCDGDMCTCIENGLPKNDCPADGLCELGQEEKQAAINTCCGWDWK